MSMRTREEIVAECAGAVASCWNYYCDTPLSDKDVLFVNSRLSSLLPLKIETSNWQKQSDAYEAYVLSEALPETDEQGIEVKPKG